MGTFFKFTAWIQKTFALWVVLFAGIALLSPETFVWMKAYITWMLGLIMFGMGMTMTLDDFKGVMQSTGACSRASASTVGAGYNGVAGRTIEPSGYLRGSKVAVSL